MNLNNYEYDRKEYISKQLIDNKIVIAEAPGYIERTLIGTVKLWLQNLSEESLKTLRSNKKSSGELATTFLVIHSSDTIFRCGITFSVFAIYDMFSKDML